MITLVSTKYQWPPFWLNSVCRPGGHYWDDSAAVLSKSDVTENSGTQRFHLRGHYLRTSCREMAVPRSKVHGANMGPTCVLSAPDGPHAGPMNLAHYDDVIMCVIASQITSLTIVYSTVYSGADQSKHQSSASLPAQRASNAENISIWWRHHVSGIWQGTWIITLVTMRYIPLIPSHNK